MCLILVYSCAFLFIKVYAKKTLLDSEALPSDRSLITEPAETTVTEEPEDMLPGVGYDLPVTTTAPVTEAPLSVNTENMTPEQLVNKQVAGRAVMKLAAATKVSDIAVSSQDNDASETTAASESSEKSAAATKKTEAETKSETKATKSESAKTSKTAETSEEEEEIFDDEEEEEELDDDSEEYDDDSEEEVADEQVDIDELTGGAEYTELTDQELSELLSRLGVSSIDELMNQSATISTDNGGFTPSSKSYKNETLTIYDTTYGQMRTDNAYDIVCEITNAEVGDSFEFEAIKAQAVAAYTYVKYYEQKGEVAEIGTKANPSSTIKKAVDAVDGLAVYYNGEYIMTPFSASQGGFSAASKNVWGGDLPYLQSVRNDFDYLDTKYYGLQTSYTVNELRERIESKTDIRLSENYYDWIRVLSNNDSIYVGEMAIDGHTTAYINGRERTITGHIFRSYILPLKSAAFTVSYSDGVFTFTTYGYGHGVGMSQIGANLYAKNGYTFDQILTHYYTGVTIK